MRPRFMTILGRIGVRKKGIEFMKNLGKALLFFFAGAAIGGASTYFYINKRYDDLMNEEQKKIAEHFEKYYSDEVENLKNRIVELELRDSINIGEPKQEEKKVKAKVKKQNLEPVDKAEYEDVVKTNYNAISENIQEEEKPVTSKKRTKKKVETKGPTIISFDDYTHDKRFDKRIITYLDQEDMFLDGYTNEPIENASDLVGDECTDLQFSEDGESVYVRNEAIGTDFEVVINVTDSYKEFCEM